MRAENPELAGLCLAYWLEVDGLVVFVVVLLALDGLVAVVLLDLHDFVTFVVRPPDEHYALDALDVVYHVDGTVVLDLD